MHYPEVKGYLVPFPFESFLTFLPAVEHFQVFFLVLKEALNKKRHLHLLNHQIKHQGGGESSLTN